MRVLILGGTIFLGRHIVEAGRARGHELVLFNRGRHNPELFPDVEKIRGDRDHDLSLLGGRHFDAVIDPSAYRPEQIRGVVEALASAHSHYVFISSISVYRSCPPGRRFDESAPVAEGHEGYGPLKARSEETLLAAMPQRAACLRAGLIVGPHDPTDRFTYWPRRVARGGSVVAPGRPDRPIQFIDARDIADWSIQLAERRTSGVFNTVGPAPLTMGQLLDECRSVSRSDAELAWLADDHLLAAGVQPWTELPLWIPEADPEHGGLLLADNRRAVAAGLTFRSVADTVEATLEWDRVEGHLLPASSIRATTLTTAREAELLRV
jgi:2'-hydroxyisoflavone reductase